MGLFEDINTARKLLDLSERATMADIKSQYRILIRKWHRRIPAHQRLL